MDEAKNLICGVMDIVQSECLQIKMNRLNDWIRELSIDKKAHLHEYLKLSEGSTLIKVLDYENLELYDMMAAYNPVKASVIKLKEECNTIIDFLNTIVIYSSGDGLVQKEFVENMEKLYSDLTLITKELSNTLPKEM